MKLRVALVTPEYPGCGPSYGVGAYVATLAGALRGAGCETLVLIAGDSGCWRIEAGREPEPCGAGGPPFAVRPLIRSGWLRTELHKWRPHVVESASWGGLGGLLRGPWRKVVRLSTPTRILSRIGFGSLASRPINHAWEASAVRAADVVIADSQAMSQLGRRVYGRASSVVIPHAYGGEIAPGLSNGCDVVFVGRLERRKGVDRLLAAWARARRHLPGRRLHIVGADPDGFGQRALARFGDDGVTMWGRIDDRQLRAVRARACLQVVPSRFESFGLVVLEAWAAGLAVVASDAGALPEVVGDAGILVPAGEPRALAATMVSLLNAPGLRQELAQRSAVRLRTRFSAAAMAAASIDAYR